MNPDGSYNYALPVDTEGDAAPDFMLPDTGGAQTTQSTGLSTGQILGAVGSALPVVGGLISGLINAHNTNVQNAANEAFQLQQQKMQNAYNLQMWNMQNAYNTPAAQMARFQAAGLNPNLIYGEASGNVAQIPQSVGVQYYAQRPDVPDFASVASQAVESGAKLASLGPQVSLTNAQSKLANQEAITSAVQAGLANSERDKLDMTNQATADNIRANTANLQQQTQSSVTTTPYTVAKLQADANLATTSANIESFLAPLDAAVKAGTVSKLAADTQFVLSDNMRQAALNSVNIQEGVANVSKILQDTATSKAEAGEIAQRTTELTNSIGFQAMDKDMRNNGIMPGDSAWERVLAMMGQFLTGRNAAGGTNAGGLNPTSSGTLKDMFFGPNPGVKTDGFYQLH